MSYSSFQELAIANNWSIEEQRYELTCYYSDVHKDAYGSRPRHIDFDSMSIEELVADVEIMAEHARQEIMEHSPEGRAELRRIELRKSAEVMLSCGAADWATAMRWAKQAA